MATVYIPDKIMGLILRNTNQKPVDYFRELAQKDIKEHGWEE